MTDRCSVPRCRSGADLVYLGSGICSVHWQQLTADDAPPDKLRMVLGIETTPAALEADMSEKKPETKTARGKKASKPAEPASETKPAKAKREMPPKEDLVVFALRMTEVERTKLHETAGPRGAARFARAVLNAAANEDEGAFKAALAEARKLHV